MTLNKSRFLYYLCTFIATTAVALPMFDQSTLPFYFPTLIRTCKSSATRTLLIDVMSFVPLTPSQILCTPESYHLVFGTVRYSMWWAVAIAIVSTIFLEIWHYHYHYFYHRHNYTKRSQWYGNTHTKM